VSEAHDAAAVIEALQRGRRPFTYCFDQRVGDGVSGLYAFWLGKRCLYVGMSVDISRRLHQHRTQEHNHRLLQYFRAWWNDIEASYVALSRRHPHELQRFERILIKHLRPLTNVMYQNSS